MTSSEQMLADDYLDDLPARPIDEIRAMRAECVDVETGLSYLRRMVQAPLDIVHHEQSRRVSGGEADLSTVVDDLAEVLADGSRPGGVGRLPQTLEPTVVDAELEADLGALLGDGKLAAITTMSDVELAELSDALQEIERRVSARRRAFHTRIDALQAELTRRYQTGEATVESLLE
jgi:hypothetical protein